MKKMLLLGVLCLCLFPLSNSAPAGVPIPNSPVVVANTAALRAITTGAVAGTVIRMTDGAAGAPPLDYVPDAGSVCSADDGGRCIAATAGGPSAYWLAQFPAAGVSPTEWGAVGDGVTNATTAMQAAINGAAAAGVPLRFDTSHLYVISSTLNVTSPLSIEGPYRTGLWTTIASGATRSCTWGLTSTANVTLLNASAVTGNITGMCLQLGASTGNGVSATAGAAIQLAPPSTATFQTGWHVERNTILNPFDGITLNGSGYNAACCGAGTTADGNLIAWNTIVNPADAGISNGKNTAVAATSGNTYWDNTIGCINTTSKASGIGFALYDGDIDYKGTNNGPEGCNIGFLVAPGTVSGASQNVGGQFEGALGDQSATHDLLLQPTTALGTVDFWNCNNCWAGATGNVNSILISGSAGGSMQEITFNNLNVHGGAGQAQPIVSIVGGAQGPYDLSIIGSNICEFGTPTTGAVGLSANLSTAGNGKYVFSGNRIGTGCPGAAVATGVALTIGSSAGSSVTLTNNDMSNVATPVSYAPNSSVLDHVIIAQNQGLDDRLPSVATASVVAFPGPYPVLSFTGTTGVSTLWAGFSNERISIHPTAGFTFGVGGGTGTLCGSTPLALASGINYDFVWQGPGAGSCWAAVQ